MNIYRGLTDTECLIIIPGIIHCLTSHINLQASTRRLKVLATIPYFNFHFFPHLLIFLQFRDPSYVLNLSTEAVLQKWHI